MTDTYVPPSQESFDFGRVMNMTFSAIRDNILPFGLAALLFIGLPYFLIYLIPVFTGVYSESLLEGDISDAYFGVFIIVAILGGLAVGLGQLILQAAIIHTSVKSLGGNRVSFNESLRVALRLFFPILGFGILSGLGIMLGTLLLIIPGVILYLMWSVGVPAMVVEKTRVMDAFGRSAELTKNNRWWILLTVIVLGIIGAVISALLMAVSLIFGVPTQEEILFEGSSAVPLILYAIANGVGTAFATLVSASGIAAVYYELRQIKEGIGVESLAAVFD